MQKIFDIFKKPAQEQEITIVSGLPRSGTSMLMRMLEAGGVPPLTDNLRTADDDNPKGYFEFEPVKKLRDGQAADMSWIPQAKGKAVKVISYLLSYLPVDHAYKVLFLQRDVEEVLASQRQMLIRRGEDPEKVSDAEMAQSFARHVAQVTAWLKEQPNMKTLFVDYNQMLKDPTPQVRQINAFLGGKLDEAQMIASVDPKLYRQRKKA
jgi:hypothetical protein